MGGVVSSVGNAVGNIVGGVGGLASGAVGAIPGVGKVLGPIASGITGGPLGFASSLAFNAATGQYGGGGGGGGGSSTPMYAQPNISYGNNTYSYGDSQINANPYFITGDRGVYNLLPALGQINAGTNKQIYTPGMRSGMFNIPMPFMGSQGNRYDKFNEIGAANAYTPYEAYQDIQTQMANDPTALAAFNKAFSPTAFNTPAANSPMAQFNANNPNPYGQYVDFNLNSPIKNQPDLKFNKLASYAAENKNPFFLPFQTTQDATPQGFTPSKSALAAIDTSNYLDQYGTARTAQNQFNREQQQAARTAREAQQQAARAAQQAARDAERNVPSPHRGIAGLRRR